jgi:hypothetical protein
MKATTSAAWSDLRGRKWKVESGEWRVEGRTNDEWRMESKDKIIFDFRMRGEK